MGTDVDPGKREKTLKKIAKGAYRQEEKLVENARSLSDNRGEGNTSTGAKRRPGVVGMKKQSSIMSPPGTGRELDGSQSYKKKQTKKER